MPAVAPEKPAPAQQLYIWQRQWTAEHTPALAQSRDDFSALRVLALQLHPGPRGPRWFQAKVDLPLLAADQRPTTLVIRLDGRLQQLSVPALLQELKPVLQSWQQAGIAVQGVELDYDSPRSQLPQYQHFLQQLKAQLHPALQLSITALPDWLQAYEFKNLLQTVDSLTLQLHSVLSPEQGLFDSELAKVWLQQLHQLSPQRYALALPAYHSALRGEGAQALVESEVPLFTGGSRQELWLDPRQVQSWLGWLAQQNLPGLEAIVWFRLPLPNDRRAWPYAVLQAVSTGQPLWSTLELKVAASKMNSTQTGQAPQLVVFAANPGNIPLQLPAGFRLAGYECTGADALQGYDLATTALANQPGWRHYQLSSATPPQLPAQGSLQLGWWNCQQLIILEGNEHAGTQN